MPVSPQLSPSDRPRERLSRLGPDALSDLELLTLLVGSGGRGRPARAIAEAVLAEHDGALRRLARASFARLVRIPGVGRATAARIVAALELGRRAASGDGPPAERIQGPEDVYRVVGPRLRDLPHEEFHALLLTAQHRVIRSVLVTRGILDASLIHPRELFREAIVENAGGMILVHNHPSGDPTPSAEDRAVTRQLVEAGRTVGIPIVDHVVIGTGCWTSFAEAGALD